MNAIIRSSDLSPKKKMDNVSRYKWKATFGHGELVAIDKNRLTIDTAYQRADNDNKVLGIARDFNWIAFGALSVSRRPNGQLCVIDGQHRWLAAMKRADVTMLPCVVYDMDGVDGEAKGFLQINKGRKPLSSLDTFKAKIVSGDETAAEVRKLAHENGFEINNTGSANTLRCVAAIERMLELKREHIIAVFPMVAEICRGQTFDHKIAQAMAYLHEVTAGQIVERTWRAKIEKLGYDGLKAAAAKAAAFFGTGTSKTWAKGIVQALNATRGGVKLPDF